MTANFTLEDLKQLPEQYPNRLFVLKDQDGNILVDKDTLSPEKVDMIMEDHAPTALSGAIYGKDGMRKGKQRYKLFTEFMVDMNEPTTEEPIPPSGDQPKAGSESPKEDSVLSGIDLSAPVTTASVIKDPQAAMFIINNLTTTVRELKEDKKRLEDKLEIKVNEINQLQLDIRDVKTDLKDSQKEVENWKDKSSNKNAMATGLMGILTDEQKVTQLTQGLMNGIKAASGQALNGPQDAKMSEFLQWYATQPDPVKMKVYESLLVLTNRDDILDILDSIILKYQLPKSEEQNAS